MNEDLKALTSDKVNAIIAAAREQWGKKAIEEATQILFAESPDFHVEASKLRTLSYYRMDCA